MGTEALWAGYTLPKFPKSLLKKLYRVEPLKHEDAHATIEVLFNDGRVPRYHSRATTAQLAQILFNTFPAVRATGTQQYWYLRKDYTLLNNAMGYFSRAVR